MKKTFTFNKSTENMKKISIIGDRHSIPFVRDKKVGQLVDSHIGELFYSRVVRIADATITSLKTNRTLIDEQVDKIVHEYQPDYLLFALGQNDIEFLYYHQAIIEKKDVTNFIPDMTEIYSAYLAHVKAKYGVEIIIKGTNPSVLVHDSTAQYHVGGIIEKNYAKNIDSPQGDVRLEIVRGLKDVNNKFEKRFEHNYQLNLALKEMSNTIGASYFDIYDKVLDSKTGDVDLAFMPSKGSHFLLDTFKLRQIYYDALLEVTQSLGNK